jgi:hypothetical protein
VWGINKKETQAHHRTAILELVHVMKLYKNTEYNSILEQANFKLFEILNATLPKYIKASTTKDFNHKLLPSREWALNNAKWLEYNKHTVNYIIIDIDDNRFNTVNSLAFYIQCLQLPTPTWICKTDKGYHVSYRLTTPFPTKFKTKIYKWALKIKEAYIDVLEGDKHAKGIKGVYRNPLLHKNDFNDVSYTLDELDIRENKNKSNFKYLKPDIDTDKISSENKLLARMMIDNKKFLLDGGKRNSTLFYYGMLIQKKGLNVEDELHKANDRYCYPILTPKEVERIIESVNSYEDKNFIPLHDKNYNEWSKEEKAKYMREYRAKNKTKTKGEIMATRSENAKKIALQRASKTKTKVIKAIAGLEFLQEKINIANVSRDAKVSRDTAKKYLIELGYKK